MNQAANASARIKAVFKKKGRSTDSTGLAEVKPELAAEARQVLKIESNDTLVLVSKVADDRWSVLTESKLIWVDSVRRGEIELNRIRGARVNFEEMQKVRQTLSSVDLIEVIIADGLAEHIPVESGGALSGFWNALLAIAKDNQRLQSN